jgi:phenylacetate-CoA ligase
MEQTKVAIRDLEEMKELIRKAKNNTDIYSEIYSNVDLSQIESAEDFKQAIPFISKDKMIEYYDSGSFDLDSKNIQKPVIGRPTSGTTSDMACYYRTKQEIDEHIERFEDAAGHYFNTGEEKDRVLVATTFSLAPILTRQFLDSGMMVTSASPFDIERTVETLITMNCNTLVCSPSISLKICERLSEKGYDNLEKFYFVSSGLSEPNKQRLEELYPDAEIMLQYGLAETGILMEQCRKLKGTNTYHLFGEETQFEYEFLNDEGKDASQGEVGELVVTKKNEKTPLIRYRVGDLFRIEEQCECGKRKFKFIGRKDDKFKVKGVTIFSDRLEDALKPVKDEINQYQIIIDEEKESDLPKPKIIIKAELKKETEEVKNDIARKFSENFKVTEDYNWKEGVDMDLFSPVEVQHKKFEERKFRKVKDSRYGN